MLVNLGQVLGALGGSVSEALRSCAIWGIVPLVSGDSQDTCLPFGFPVLLAEFGVA